LKGEVKKKDITSEFLILEEVCWTKEHQKRVVNDAEYALLNRYSDILTYEDTRVKLPTRPGRPKTDSYINASYVNSPLGADRKFIACQGPKSNTVEHFWRMVVQERVTLIVCVCKLAEQGRSKCHKYWPEQDNHQEFEAFNEFKISLVNADQVSENFLSR